MRDQPEFFFLENEIMSNKFDIKYTINLSKNKVNTKIKSNNLDKIF